MKNILVIAGSSYKNGNTDILADAFIKGAKKAGNHVKRIFLGTKLVRYIDFHDKGMVLAGGCGGTSSKRFIKDTPYLIEAYEFSKEIYKSEK